MYEKIANEARLAICELLDTAAPAKGEIVVIGCSSSEIMGDKIGKGTVPEAAETVLKTVLPIIEEKGLYLAAQCCEHLNRALVVERQAAEKFGLEIVAAGPKPKAGGSFATAAYLAFREPVLVESVKASAGLDVGCTMIGMHLKRVAVPIRLKNDHIGSALVLAARTRPKFIGGSRAQYE